MYKIVNTSKFFSRLGVPKCKRCVRLIKGFIFPSPTGPEQKQSDEQNCDKMLKLGINRGNKEKKLQIIVACSYFMQMWAYGQ